MFCYKCGSEVAKGANFCPVCGADLSAITAPEIVPTHQKEPEPQTIESANVSDDELIADIFYSIFQTRKMLGAKVYIIGIDNITEEIAEGICYNWLSSEDDIPLLFFNYGKNYDEGFVITTKKFIWHYGSRNLKTWDLQNIKEVKVGKAVLATVMKLVSFDNIESSEIFLTGIREENDFVIKFRQFIREVNKVYHPQFHAQSKAPACASMDFMDLETVISQACQLPHINSIYCVIGNPYITSNYKKYAKAVANFDIPPDEHIFLIYDSTISGSCQKGFSLCSSGIYYRERQQGYISWQDFARMRFSCGITGLKLGNLQFNVASDGKNLLVIFEAIQSQLSFFL